MGRFSQDPLLDNSRGSSTCIDLIVLWTEFKTGVDKAEANIVQLTKER